MPGKSQRKLSRSKRKESRRVSPARTILRQAIAPTYPPVSQPEVSAPPASMPTPTATLAAARYPYIATELRRIGILSGIMLAILIVLALVLS